MAQVKESKIYTLEEFQSKISDRFRDLPIYAEPAGLYQPISYTLSQGGKRIRPLLVLLSNQMFGGDPDEALPAAVAIEIFHNFTLLHDDVIDQAPLRRGLETVYQKWNTNVAILSGDTMFAIAYGELAKSNPAKLPELMRIFTTTAIEVCEGQQYDIDFEQSNKVDLDSYLNMIKLKTAVLLAASLKIGALIANASADEAQKIYDFGIYMGIAFQLQDDLLDTFGNQDVFGKQTGGDIAANKKTVLFIKALEKSDSVTKSRLLNYYMGAALSMETKVKEVTGIFEELDVKAETEGLIDQYFNKAMAVFDSIKVAESNKETLRQVLSSLLKRSK